MGNKSKVLITASFLAIAQNASAVDLTWGGYLNAVGAVSDSDTPYLQSEIDNRGSYNDTSFGLNIGIDLEEGLKLAAQLWGHEKAMELDWAFASYQLNEAANLAVGRLKYPANLVSEYHDIGYLYPWIRPPREIYSHSDSSATMSLEAFNGARFLYDWYSEDIEYGVQLYAGAAEEDIMNHDKMVGAVFTLSTGATQFLLGLNRSNMEMVNMPMAPMNKKDMTVMAVGATTEWHNFVAYAEYTASETADVPLLDTTAWYTTLGYNFGKTLPHITYSSLDQDTGLGQGTWTLGLRHELTTSSALKLEWQRIRPEAVTAAGVAAVPMLGIAGVPNKSGLFESIPAESEIDMFSVAVNIFF